MGPLVSSDVAEGAAYEAEEIVEKKSTEDKKRDHDGDGCGGMSRGEPS